MSAFMGTPGPWEVSAEDVAVLHRIKAALPDVGVNGWYEGVQALDRVLSSLSQQPPAEAHCATCSCAPGMTPAVRFDTAPAEREGVVRDHLIRMGWTPPAEARGGVDGWRLVVRYGEYDSEPGVWAEKDGSLVWIAAISKATGEHP